jgi:broad specificity phosphatase PhoE
MEKINSKKLYEKNSLGKFLYIRHGETNYNKNFSKYKPNKIRTDKDYIDCNLNSIGIAQAKKIKKLIENFEIETVYVSPLYRSIETASIIFDSENKKNNFKIYVHPLLTESVSGVHNFTYNLTEKQKKIFNNFDWSIFNNYFKTELEQNFYYLNYIDLIDNKLKTKEINKIFNIYNTNKILLPEAVSNFSKFGVNLGLKRFESLKHIFLRNLEFKNFLKKTYTELNTINDKNKKVIVITHNAFCKMSTSLIAEENINNINNDFPNDCYSINNCEIISMLI